MRRAERNAGCDAQSHGLLPKDLVLIVVIHGLELRRWPWPAVAEAAVGAQHLLARCGSQPHTAERIRLRLPRLRLQLRSGSLQSLSAR